MLQTRREFISLAFTGATVGLGSSLQSGRAGELAPESPFKAVAFDVFCLFDPRPVLRLAEKLVPENGQSLGGEWHLRRFEYTWLRVVKGRYEDFWTVTRGALEFAAGKLKLELIPEARAEILFVTYGGWDAEGAQSFGYPTFWTNRRNSPPERLGLAKVASGKDLSDLLTGMKFLPRPGN